MKDSQRTNKCVVLAVAVSFLAAPALAAPTLGSIDVLNHSFESPPTTFATPVVAAWDETGPETTVVFAPGQEFTGLLDTGVFLNTPIFEGDTFVAGPISNATGQQLAFIQVNPTASPEVTLSQTTGAVFEIGAAYKLNVAVGIGFGFATPTGDPATLELALGYFDSGAAFNEVAATLVDVTDFPLGTQPSDEQFDLIDIQVLTPVFGGGEGALGQNIAIQFRVIDGASGAWNLDNVRLAAIPEPGSAVVLVLSALTCLSVRRRRS